MFWDFIVNWVKYWLHFYTCSLIKTLIPSPSKIIMIQVLSIRREFCLNVPHTALITRFLLFIRTISHMLIKQNTSPFEEINFNQTKTLNVIFLHLSITKWYSGTKWKCLLQMSLLKLNITFCHHPRQRSPSRSTQGSCHFKADVLNCTIHDEL